MNTPFHVTKGQVIEAGEGHSFTAKRDGMAYWEGEQLRMLPDHQGHPTMTTNTPGAGEFPPLKRCPFCGGEAEQFDIHTLTWHKRYGCAACGIHFNDEESWNRRAQAAEGEQSAAHAAAPGWSVTKTDEGEFLVRHGERGRVITRSESSGFLFEFLAALAATPAPAHPLPVAGWQPISTAPKDQILMLAAEFDRPGDWRMKCGYYQPEDGTWRVWGASWQPSMWQPMPNPPEALAHAAPAGEKGAMDALRHLVSQIEKSSPVDDHGHLLTKNIAFINAKGLL